MLGITIFQEAEVDLNLQCEVCSTILDAWYDETRKTIIVVPCEHCLEMAECEAQKEGGE